MHSLSAAAGAGTQSGPPGGAGPDGAGLDGAGPDGGNYTAQPTLWGVREHLSSEGGKVGMGIASFWNSDCHSSTCTAAGAALWQQCSAGMPRATRG